MSGSSQLKRSAFLGLSLLRATAHRPPSPLKLNLCLTYWCQYRCKTCNIWQRKPSDELTTDEITALIQKNPDVNWVDLTGGEIFLRPDIDEIFDAIISGWARLAILHFPTNGFLTDGIVRRVTRLAGRSSARLVVTVSVDGDEALNDRIRGIQGGFRRQMETFRQLREIPGVTAALGMTLSTENSGQFDRTFAACARECPGLTVNDVHLNVAQRSSHYYGNQDLRHRAGVTDRSSGNEAVSKSSFDVGLSPSTARACVSPESRRFSGIRSDADAVSRASRELFHRSLGGGLPVHYLLEAAGQPARHGHVSRTDLERERNRPAPGGDLEGLVSAMLDGV